MRTRKELYLEILDILKDRMKNDPNDYCNPYFMHTITEAIYNYYEVEDDEVDEWILDMFDA